MEYSNFDYLERGQAVYETVLGEVTEFTVSVDKGDDVMFDYDMDDGIQYKDRGSGTILLIRAHSY